MVASSKWIEGIGPETPAAEAARRALELRLATVAQRLPLAAYLAEHDVEHVHQLRVATRRAAAAVKLYRDWLPRKQASWIRKRLRQVRRAAGVARDLDVLAERFRRDPTADTNWIETSIAEKRAAWQPSIVKLAEKLRHDDRFVRRTARLIREIKAPNLTNDSAPPLGFGDWASQQILQITSKFVDSWPTNTADIEALHQFRIGAKALRYAIELLAPAFGSQLCAELYPAVEELQEQLGKITDHIAAMKILSECQLHASDDNRQSATKLLEAEKYQQEEDLHSFQLWWTTDRAESLKRGLAEQWGDTLFHSAKV